LFLLGYSFSLLFLALELHPPNVLQLTMDL
jgi:hypothetical protein